MVGNSIGSLANLFGSLQPPSSYHCQAQFVLGQQLMGIFFLPLIFSTTWCPSKHQLPESIFPSPTESLSRWPEMKWLQFFHHPSVPCQVMQLLRCLNCYKRVPVSCPSSVFMSQLIFWLILSIFLHLVGSSGLVIIRHCKNVTISSWGPYK